MSAIATSKTESPSAVSVLVLLAGIERHGPSSPAAIVFRAALRRKGQEAHAVGVSGALDTLQREVATTDPGRAEARAEILIAAWSGLPGWRS